MKKAIPLLRLRPGQRARVVEIRSESVTRLHHLAAFGLLPGSLIVMRQLRPALVLSIGETEISVDASVAGEIMVHTA